MNMTNVINDIKLTLGLNTIALPYDKPVEVVIQEILHTSIRTFSQFKPHIRECYELKKNLRTPVDVNGKQFGIYYIPDALTVTSVMYVDAYNASVENGMGEATTNAFTVGSPFVGFGSYYPQDILNATATGAAINKYAGITSTQPTSKWLGHNKIQLFNFPENSYVHFVAKCHHDMNGETIEESCVESFMSLAILDVKRTLYNQLKNMTDIGGAFKETKLKIDDWSSAEQDRNQLVRDWTDNFHYDEIEELVQFF